MKSAANVFWERFLHSCDKLLIDEDFIFYCFCFIRFVFRKH